MQVTRNTFTGAGGSRSTGAVMEPSEIMGLATALGDEALNDLLAPYLGDGARAAA